MSNTRLWTIIATVLTVTTLCLAADKAPQLAPNVVIGRDNPFGQVAPPAKTLIEEDLPVEILEQPQPVQVQARPELFVETVTVQWFKAENLKVAVEKMCTPFGSITTDPASNSLIICDTRENVDKMLAQIRNVDRTPQLVEIEVAIIDVQLDSDTDVGFNWDMLSTDKDNPAFRQNYTTRLGAIPPNTATLGSASAYNTTGVGSDVSIVVGTVRSVLHLLQTKRKVEILATPRVLVLSGKTGSVETVEEIPYQEQTDTSNGGLLTSTQFKNVGVKLNVQVQVTDDNSILLMVTPEQNINTGVFGINNVPIIDTRRANSNLILRDGEIVVMGGLRRKEKSKVRDQIPFLGSIPVVGKLFGRDKENVINSELIVFIAPHIYKGQNLTAAELQKYQQIKSLPSLAIDPNTITETPKQVSKTVSPTQPKPDTAPATVQTPVASDQTSEKAPAQTKQGKVISRM